MLIRTRDEFLKARSVLLDAPLIAIDTETNISELWEARKMMGFSVSCPIVGRDMNISFYFPFRHNHDRQLFSTDENLPIEWLKDLRPVWQRTDVTWVLHNAKFDLEIFYREGVEFSAKFYDTMVMSWMVDENTSHALKLLSKRLFKDESDYEQKQLKKIEKGLGGWEKIPPEVMAKYACKDTELTLRLYEHFLPLLEQQEMNELWKHEHDFVMTLLHMERRGIRVDVQKAKRHAYQSECRMQEIRDQLKFDPMKPDELAHTLFSKKPEGLGFVPGPLGKPSKSFPKGRPVMDKHVLANYTHPLVDSVLEYRGLVKAKSTWFEGFLAHVGSDGRMHPDYRHSGTLTTRLSCAKPNMQQIPRTTEEEIEAGVSRALVKGLIIPNEGYRVYEFDYSQIEFRLAACYAKEPVLLSGYLAGRDFHTITAELLGIHRQHAKTINFAILYGAGPRKLAEQLGTDEATGRRVLAEFRSAYPRLSEVAIQAEKAAETRGYVRYWDGRRRHFQYPSEYHKAFNSVVQGGAARIMFYTMLKFYREYPEIQMISQVHDALWFEVKKGDEETLQIIQKIMEWPGQEFPIPFPVEVKVLN